MRTYVHIKHYSKSMFKMFKKGHHIVIQEKIDGSQANFICGDDGLHVYSSDNELSEEFGLKGCYQWVQNYRGIVQEKFPGLMFHGEWLTPHHCEYPADKYNKFYLFDISNNGEYLPWNEVKRIAAECNFLTVPCLFDGVFESYEQVFSYLGKTEMGGEQCEGIVVKNMTTLNGSYHFYTKIVTNAFKESMDRPDTDISYQHKSFEMEEQSELVHSIVTEARVRKSIYKLVKAGKIILPYEESKHKEIYKALKSYIFSDCMREEKEITNKVGKSFGMHLDAVLKDMDLMALFKEVEGKV